MNSPRTGTGGRIGSVVGRFRRDRRGATAIEFGLVVVPFLGLLAAIMETGFVFFNATGLEAAVQDAARNFMTGKAQGANIADATTFANTYICSPTAPNVRILPSFIDCSQLIVDVRTTSSFASADTSRNFYQKTYTRKFCPGAPKDIVIVRVAYPMPVYLPIIVGFSTITTVTNGLVDVDGKGLKHLLVATAVFQNEPYDQSAYTKPNGC